MTKGATILVNDLSQRRLTYCFVFRSTVAQSELEKIRLKSIRNSLICSKHADKKPEFFIRNFSNPESVQKIRMNKTHG